jgi:hypothetical protein
LLFASEHRPDIGYDSGNRARGRRKGTCQKGSAPFTLPPFEVAVAGGDAVFSRLQLVAVHGDTHGTTRLAPVGSSFPEYPIQTFGLRLFFDDL